MTAPVASYARRARRTAKPPEPPDVVTRYALDVVAGRIVTGLLVRLAAERHIRDLADGPTRGLYFDRAAAEKAISFFPLLRHYKGEWGPRPGHLRGDPIVLEGWQAFVIGSLFGWKRADGRRRFNRGYLEVAKKNGKTLLAAGLGILLAFFDGEPGAEVYSIASKRDQAKLVWLDAVRLIQRSASLARRLVTLAGSIAEDSTASKFQPLGRDSDSDQGINPHGVIVDELHILAERDPIDNAETAMSSRRQPMVLKITTAGTRGATVWEDERSDAVAVLEGRAADDATFVAIYTLDEGDDPFDEAVWPKANPNLGVSVKIDDLREAAARAARAPSRLAAFLRFRMNVPTNVSTRWLDMDEWDANTGRLRAGELVGEELLELDETLEEFERRIFPPGRSGYGGLDLASVRDLTAFAALFRTSDGTFDVLLRFWCPEEGIEKRSRLDGVPYADWVRDGYLKATSGNVTDYDVVREDIRELAERYHFGEIGFDRWNATQLATQLTSDGAAMIAIPQTYLGLSPASKELEKLVLSRKLRHGGHPVLRWMAGNVEVETDPLENIRPSKGRSSERIDGIVAVVMALARWIANGVEPAEWTAA